MRAQRSRSFSAPPEIPFCAVRHRVPAKDIIANKEYALAAGAGNVLGTFGSTLVIVGVVLATSSAISGTLFGASRRPSRKRATPRSLSVRKRNIPVSAILVMAAISSFLILIGGLQLILEFGSIRFVIVSLLITITNLKVRKQTQSSFILTLPAVIALADGGGLILYYEFSTALHQMLFIVALYIALIIGAYLFARRRQRQDARGTGNGI